MSRTWRLTTPKKLLVLSFIFISLPSFSKVSLVEDDGFMPTYHHIKICSNHSCQKISHIYNFDAEWQQIVSYFNADAIHTPEQERDAIANTVAIFEQLIAPFAGTAKDTGKNRFPFTEGQTDCVDETSNTRTLLKLLAHYQLLKFHSVSHEVYRFPPHYAASIKENGSSQVYAVDSWYFDNGMPAVVLPLSYWQIEAIPNVQRRAFIQPTHVLSKATVKHEYVNRMHQEEH